MLTSTQKSEIFNKKIISTDLSVSEEQIFLMKILNNEIELFNNSDVLKELKDELELYEI